MAEESWVDQVKRENPWSWYWTKFWFDLGYIWWWIKDEEMADGRTYRTKRLVNPEAAEAWKEIEVPDGATLVSVVVIPDENPE